MDRNAWNRQAKACQYVEEQALAHQSRLEAETRATAQTAGLTQTMASQTEALRMLTRLSHAASVIAVGTGSLVEAMALVEGLNGHGQLTAVDSSAQGVELVRRAFAGIADDTEVTLRAVNAEADVFLPRLNANDYDLIVVSGDAANYAPTLAQAPRLLREHGTIVFTDAMAFAGPDAKGGVPDPADRSDKAVAMRDLLDELESSEDFVMTLTAIGTGMAIATRR